MRAEICYWFVLLIYAGLWGCQMFVCNSTHSLIVLTDSYINLYYMIEIVLELFYLRVQSKLGCSSKETGWPTYRILNQTCTYQFKRLPLLGSFMNSVFLMALLMYAAIEGIQSCFHAHHLIYEGGKSILLENKLTYPGLLVGFACVSVLMRPVLNSVHKLKEQEIAKRNIKLEGRRQLDQPSSSNTELTKPTATKANNSHVLADSQGEISLSQLTPNKNSQDATGIILKAFKINSDLSGDKISSVCISVENSHQSALDAPMNYGQRAVRHTVSPIALVACAIVVYFVMDDLVTEIVDAVLAIVVVVVSYIASYPSMDCAGRILLQAAPMDVDVSSLLNDLQSINSLVLSVDELHVWALTNDSGLVGSCNLTISKDNVENDLEIAAILRDAKLKFLSKGVKCSCIQPILFSLTEEAAKEGGEKGEEDVKDHGCADSHGAEC